MTRIAALLLIAAAALPAFALPASALPVSGPDLRVEITGGRSITYIVQAPGEAPASQTHRMAPGLRSLRLAPAASVAAAMLAGG